jgi:hypothetical protein
VEAYSDGRFIASIPQLLFMVPLGALPVPIVAKERACQSDEEDGDGYYLGEFGGRLQSGQSLDGILDIGIGQTAMSQFMQNAIMPVGKRAIADTVKNAQDKPGHRGEQQGEEVEFTCFFPDPAQSIEQSEDGVKYQEEEIAKVKKERTHTCLR